jgi:hypothetical protein
LNVQQPQGGKPIYKKCVRQRQRSQVPQVCHQVTLTLDQCPQTSCHEMLSSWNHCSRATLLAANCIVG